MAFPTYDDLLNPLLKAMHNLGGSATIQEMEDEVSKLMKLTEKEINEVHRGNRTKLNYRLAWARNYLKRFGVLENSSRGIWALTSYGQKIRSVNKTEVKKRVWELDRKESPRSNQPAKANSEAELAEDWKTELLETLQKMTPAAFERLSKRLLRESGFTQVEVTKMSNDGGIDGIGVLKIGGMLSFPVVFQSKRYKGKVGSSIVRNLRGAMVGRTDKGLLITTGTFTREARD